MPGKTKERGKKSGKSGGKKSGKKGAKKSAKGTGSARVRMEKEVQRDADMLDPSAMFNLYYIAHGITDAMEIRGFDWPTGGKKKKKKGGKKKGKKK